MSQSIRISLVGREALGEENLGLRYVAAALKAAGHALQMHSLEALSEVPSIARSIIDFGAEMVGLALSDPTACIEHLVLANYLRTLGYQGHIVAGGAFATLVRHELLERHPAIDSIVRHAGEQPAVELARRLAVVQPWQGTPGLTTRAGDGVACAPHPGDESLRPLRPEKLHTVLGVPVARLLASRGCNGTCKYCGSSALRRMALKEGRQAGLTGPAMKKAGIGARQRRDVDDVAAEISELYHRRGVRVLQIVDDNLLGDLAGESLPYARELATKLHELNVRKMAWTMMIDPESVTPPMLDALKALGVVRLFIGVESLTEVGMRSLGRTAKPEVARRAVELCREQGLATVFNDIIVHPQATAGSIAAELDALAEMPAGVYFEVNPLLVYPMTDLYATLRGQGRLSGGIFGSEYEPEDPVARRFHAILVRLALALSSAGDPALHVHHVSLNVAIAQRLELGRYSEAIQVRIDYLLDECNRARVSALRAALALSLAEVDGSGRERGVQAIVSQLLNRCLDLSAQADELHLRLEPRDITRTSERQNTLATRASRSITLLSLGAVLGCGASVDDVTGVGAPGTGGTNSNSTGAISGASSTNGGSTGTGGGKASTGGASSAPVQSTIGACSTTSWFASGATGVVCASDIPCLLNAVYNSAAVQCTTNVNFHLFIDANGAVVDVAASTGDTLTAALKQCILDTLANERFPCLSGHEIWGQTPVVII